MQPVEPGELRAALRQALTTTSTEEELAAALVASGVLTTVAETATVSVAEAARALGIQADSVRKLMHKSPAFPTPVIDGRRFSTAQIHHYRLHRTPKQKHS